MRNFSRTVIWYSSDRVLAWSQCEFQIFANLIANSKTNFPVLVYDLLIKLNYEWRNNSESLLEPLCCFAFGIVVRFIDDKLVFVFILCLYGQHLEQNPEIKRSIPSLTFWYDFSSSSGEKKNNNNNKNNNRRNWPMIKDILKRKFSKIIMTTYKSVLRILH